MSYINTVFSIKASHIFSPTDFITISVNEYFSADLPFFDRSSSSMNVQKLSLNDFDSCDIVNNITHDIFYDVIKSSLFYRDITAVVATCVYGMYNE